MLFAAAEIAQTPTPWMILPFAGLLLTIALAPLFFSGWWGRHYPKVAIGLGSITLAYYLFGLQAGPRVFDAFHEYVSFIAMIGALYVVSGGIHIQVKGEATPWANLGFLAVGTILANVLGTTGASMLLIRPWIRMNKYRITAHHIVFFIFIVSNVAGCLTPIGDPPLFLGYIKGIPFWWVAEHCWPMWGVGVGTLLVMFLVVDIQNYRRVPKPVRDQHSGHGETFKVSGLLNILFLGAILGAILFAGNPPFLREAIMVASAVGSYFLTPRSVHESNDFNFHPVKEVAILFIGIFATMMPALDWLAVNARELGDPSPTFFYFGSGILSSVLDNAPTYLSFLSAIFGAFIDNDAVAQVQHLVQTGGSDLATFVHGDHAEQIRQTFVALQKYHGDLVASKKVGTEEIEIAYLLGNVALNRYILSISVGAVFFGANTYIGNGPNFMVKAIADQAGVKTPSFLAYIGRFTLPFMLPMLLLVWAVFFR
jgi:Na+/H+ antiporter NhaD/arsenite permease-like protein